MRDNWGWECHCRREGEEITTRENRLGRIMADDDLKQSFQLSCYCGRWIVAIITMRCSLHMLDSSSDLCLLGQLAPTILSSGHAASTFQFFYSAACSAACSFLMMIRVLPKYPLVASVPLHSSALCDLEVMSRIYFATTLQPQHPV